MSNRKDIIKNAKMVEVEVMVYADGKLVDSFLNKQVQDFAVEYVAMAAIAQVQEPDLSAALDLLDE